MPFTYRLEYATRTKDIVPSSVGKINVVREQDEAFFREKMSGGVKVVLEDYNFIRDAGIYAVECCQEISFIIYRECSGGRSIYWEGYFTLYDVEWDEDNQEATIKKVTVKDPYNAIFANWHKEINWFGDIAEGRPAASYPPVHPLQTFTHASLQSEDYNPSGSNLYYRGFYFNYAILWLVKETMKETGFDEFADITEEQMSTFLTAEINPANGKPNYLRDVILMHISDAKRPGASRPAWIGNVTLKAVLADLKNLYNAYWYIDEDNHFRIEHISYFRNFSYEPAGITLDLTTQAFAKNVDRKKKYSFQSDQLNGREGVESAITLNAFDQESKIWTDFANPSRKEFNAAYMYYGEACVPKSEKGEASERYQIISLFTTDWRTVTYKPDTVPDQGWVLVHVPILLAENGVAYGWIPIQNELYFNGNMALSRLFFEFGRTELSFAWGMLTYEKESSKKPVRPEQYFVKERPVRAKSTKRIKTFAPIDLSICCGDDYDFSGFIKHPLDDACVVERMEIDLKNENITITLISATSCDDIPIPDYEEPEEPGAGECPEAGRLIRTEEGRQYTQHTPIEYVYIFEYTDYFADGNCGEYTKTRVVTNRSKKRANGPR